MITPNDGKYCPHCNEYVNPWVIRSAIARGDDTFRCRACGWPSDLDDLIEVSD